MDREAAPRRIGGLRAPLQSLDEVAMIELDVEGDASEVLGRKLERGLRKIDAVIVADPGARERWPHLAGIAARDVEKGEGLGDSIKCGVEDLPHLFVREGVGIH